MFQIKVPKEMAAKKIEEYKISEKAVKYMHRKVQERWITDVFCRRKK